MESSILLKQQNANKVIFQAGIYDEFINLLIEGIGQRVKLKQKYFPPVTYTRLLGNIEKIVSTNQHINK